MIVVIKDCGTNIASVLFALERLGKEYILSSDPDVIQQASHVIVPGVSTAKRALDQLQMMSLTQTIRNCRQPVLGICSGMQILFDWCEEGEIEGLRIFHEKVSKLAVTSDLSLPHMGWNTLVIHQQDHPLLAGIAQTDYVYFVHSYAAPVDEYTVASCEYGAPFSAVVVKGNFYGTQFHPERSGKIGARIINNFLQCGNEYANTTCN